MVVDDEPAALAAMLDALTRRFGADYRIVPHLSAPAALAAVSKTKEDGEEIALVIADQWMPEMTGNDRFARKWDVGLPGAADSPHTQHRGEARGRSCRRRGWRAHGTCDQGQSEQCRRDHSDECALCAYRSDAAHGLAGRCARARRQGFIGTGHDVDLASWPVDRKPMDFETSVPGIFAVGDVRRGSMKRRLLGGRRRRGRTTCPPVSGGSTENCVRRWIAPRKLANSGSDTGWGDG